MGRFNLLHERCDRRFAGFVQEHSAFDLHDAVKAIFDPRGILNPGKKLSRA